MKRAVLLLAISSGCAREARPPQPPAYTYPVSAYGWVLPPAGAEPRYASLAPPSPPPLGPTSAPAPVASRPDVPTFASSALPSGDACVAELTRLGVAFNRLDEKRGVSTPVEVVGKINGIRYQSGSTTYMLADCRLVLALHRIAPVLSELGILALRFSGAYSYRMSRVGRLSLHAHGLALDVHEIQFASGWQSVERDFVRGLADGCEPKSPPLNQLACRLRATHLFKELLTPDYDADHANHIHLAIAPVEVPKSEAPKAAKPPPKRVVKVAKPPPEPAPPPDDGEPTVEPDPDEPPPLAKPEPKAKAGKPKRDPKPTRPARHSPRRKPLRPAAS